MKSARCGNLHKYLRYSEARRLFERMNRDAVLVFYQHFPRVNHSIFLKDLHSRLQDKLECPEPVSITDSRIALVTVAKEALGRESLRKVIQKYS